MTQATLDFYFDYSSPYGYLASERIEAVAARHNRTLRWHPILLGAIFKLTGQQPLTEAPLKGDYAIKDFNRSARQFGINYQHPSPFPIGSIAACRATIWIRENDNDTVCAKQPAFIHSVFRAFYVEGKDITDATVLMQLAADLDIDPDSLAQGIGTPTIKDALRQDNEAAIARGVFGSPMFIADDEPFWGHDRIEQLDRWLETGGW